MQCLRRRFVELALTGLPAVAVFGAGAADRSSAFAAGVGEAATGAVERSSASAAVRLGVQTYSFRDMLGTPGDMTDKMIAAMRELGLTECEVFEPTLQPPTLSADAPWRMTDGKPTQASLLGRPPTGTPTAAVLADREAVRKWRLGAGLEQVGAAAEKFKRAGIRVFAFNFLLKDWCTDQEVHRGFQMTQALGANIMTASTTLTMANRTVPFVEKYQTFLGLHGHSNLSDPNQFATPDSFVQGLAMSPFYRVNLDIGHFSAAGFDSVAFIRAHHDRITNLHIKDRRKNDGPNVPFGEGDTPIKPVLRLLETERYPIPAYIEYEYAGGGTSTQELAKCLEYVKAALA
jgi:sugar phosphate isomerase/epimerase